MGEAKRRAKIDSNYGKLNNLCTTALKEKQAELVLQELFANFPEQIHKLLTAQCFPEDYSEICGKIGHWLQERLAVYYPEDREYIVRFTVNLIYILGREYSIRHGHKYVEVSPVFICCFFRVAKNYFVPEELKKLAKSIETYFAEEHKDSAPTAFEQSIYEEMQQILV